MGILSKAFAGGYDPREEAARGASAARAAAEYWTGRVPVQEPERPEPVAIYTAPCGERREIDSWETVDWLLSFPADAGRVTLLKERPAETEPVVAPAEPEPAAADEEPAPAPVEPAPATPAKTETPWTHELILVGRKGLEVLEPITGLWEDWNPASVVDHLRENPHHQVQFYPSRKVFYDPKSRVRTMTAKQAVDFLRNSGRL